LTGDLTAQRVEFPCHPAKLGGRIAGLFARLVQLGLHALLGSLQLADDLHAALLLVVQCLLVSIFQSPHLGIMLGTLSSHPFGVLFPRRRQLGRSLLLHSRKFTANLGQLALQVCRLLGESGHVGALGGKLGFHRPACGLRFIASRPFSLQVVMHLVGPLLQLGRPRLTSRRPLGLCSHVGLKAGSWSVSSAACRRASSRSSSRFSARASASAVSASSS
jgi:hypothetical protein